MLASIIDVLLIESFDNNDDIYLDVVTSIEKAGIKETMLVKELVKNKVNKSDLRKYAEQKIMIIILIYILLFL